MHSQKKLFNTRHLNTQYSICNPKYLIRLRQDNLQYRKCFQRKTKTCVFVNFFGAQKYYWRACLFTKQKLKGFSHQKQLSTDIENFYLPSSTKKNKSAAQKNLTAGRYLAVTTRSPKDRIRLVFFSQDATSNYKIFLEEYSISPIYFQSSLLRIISMRRIRQTRFLQQRKDFTRGPLRTWFQFADVRRRRGVLENSKDASVRFGALQIKAVGLEAAPRDGVERSDLL